LDSPGRFRLRTRARIDSRKRLAGENPGAPTSLNLRIPIILYSPADQVDQIGRILSQHSVYLKDPTENIGTNIELMNPHAPKERPRYLPWNASAPVTYTQSGYITRTAEEAASDVMSMFDSLIKKAADLYEKEPDSRIITPLLQHQRQALYFMTEREKEGGILDLESENQGGFSLWKKKITGHGKIVYYNVITGKREEI
jgi:hypothetical protein